MVGPRVEQKNKQETAKSIQEKQMKNWSVGKVQVPVVQRLDNAIHRINRYPADKC